MPFSLRGYQAFGFQDPGWTWDYNVDPLTAARLTRELSAEPETPRALVRHSRR